MDHSPSFQKPKRNSAVIAAVWILGIIAVLELIAASIALAPRILTAVRSGGGNGTPDVAASTTNPNPAVQGIPLPSNPPPPKSLHENEANNPTHTENVPSLMPFKPASSDSAAQGGSTLGIVSVKLDAISETSRKLVIAMKANPRESIDVPQVKVQVYFYDTDGTEITASKAQSISRWISSGTDWKNGEPELLEVRYLPDAADSQISFAGYVVAIYYKGDLQDYRAEPSNLTKLFPLKYFIGTDE